MKIVNMAGKKVSFKRYVNNNCLRLVDDLKMVQEKYPKFTMKETFLVLARTSYLKDIDEPRAVINPRNEMLELVNEKGKFIKLVGIKKD